MANVLRPELQEQVRALGRLGWSLRRIERTIGVRRETIRDYLIAAGIAVRWPRGRRLALPTDQAAPPNPASEVTTDPRAAANPASEVFPDPGDGKPRVPSRCEPHREFIADALGRGRNAKAIWQDLVDRLGFAGHYESVKRFVRQLRPCAAAIVHPRIETAPGEEAQVDYGTGPLVRDPQTGKYRRTRLFALTLGCSRKAVWLLTWRSSARTWCELHEEAFRRLGGTPRTIVLDNLREGVLTPDVHDPTVNPLYRALLAHYHVVALPARVRDPDRKGKVESSIGFAQKTPLRGMRFESLEEAQRYLDQWTARWADTRIHGTTKRQVAAMFAEERPSLQPLPLEPFRYFEHGVRVVHLDGCIEVARGYYGVPPRWIGQEVHVRWDQLYVRILDPKTGALLREHVRQKPGHYRIDERDRSPRTPPSIAQLLQRARVAGKHVGLLCEQLEQRRDQYSARQILGVLSLVKRRGFGVVDDCCRTALETGVASYRLVRNLVDRTPTHGPQLRQVDGLIRELTLYRDLIDRKTNGHP
jgi:transposase